MKNFPILFALMIFVMSGCGGGGGGTASTSGAAAKPLSSITVSPGSSSVAVGGTTQFIATGTYTDGTTQDITASVTWNSSEASVCTISNVADSIGKATALTAGTTTITAVSGDITGSTPFTIIALNPLTDVFLGGYHHIGDGIWSGEINSQFSYPTVGKTYSENFTLKDQPQQFAYATITFTHRGIESSAGYGDVLMINSYAIPLKDSNPDGSYTAFNSGKLPANIFLPNQTNTITLQSGNVPWNLTRLR